MSVSDADIFFDLTSVVLDTVESNQRRDRSLLSSFSKEIAMRTVTMQVEQVQHVTLAGDVWCGAAK